MIILSVFLFICVISGTIAWFWFQDRYNAWQHILVYLGMCRRKNLKDLIGTILNVLTGLFVISVCLASLCFIVYIIPVPK